MFPYLITESAYSVVLVVFVVPMLLAQFLACFSPHFFRNPPTEHGRLKAFTALSIVTPALIFLLLIVAVHQGRITMLNAFSHSEPAERFVMLAVGYSIASIQKLYSGYALVITGLVGALCSIFWLCRLRKKGATAISMVVSAGVGISSIVMGLGLSLRERPFADALNMVCYMDGVERALFHTKVLKNSPSLSWPFIVGAVIVVITGLVAFWRAWREKTVFKVGNAASASGMVVLLVGGCAFVSTLGYADDVQKTLPRLYDTTAEGCLEVVLVPDGPNRPRLENWRKLKPYVPAPVIVIDDDQVVIEGNLVGRYGEIVGSETVELNALREHLKNIEKNFRQIHWLEEFPGKVLLDGDLGAPGQVIGKVLVTCYRGGYRHVQLMTVLSSSLPTTVFGELTLTRLAWVPFTLTEEDESGALPFKQEETYGEFARRVDEAAGKGAVKVLVPGFRQDSLD